MSNRQRFCLGIACGAMLEAAFYFAGRLTGYGIARTAGRWL